MKRDRGAVTSEFSIYFMVAIFLLSLAFGVFPPFIQYIKQYRLNTVVVREAELTGEIGSLVMDEYEDTAKKYGLEPTGISFDGTEYIGGTKKVQINDEICITITSDYQWFSPFLGGEGLDFQITTLATGKSGVFHK